MALLVPDHSQLHFSATENILSTQTDKFHPVKVLALEFFCLSRLLYKSREHLVKRPDDKKGNKILAAHPPGPE